MFPFSFFPVSLGSPSLSHFHQFPALPLSFSISFLAHLLTHRLTHTHSHSLTLSYSFNLSSLSLPPSWVPRISQITWLLTSLGHASFHLTVSHSLAIDLSPSLTRPLVSISRINRICFATHYSAWRFELSSGIFGFDFCVGFCTVKFNFRLNSGVSMKNQVCFQSMKTNANRGFLQRKRVEFDFLVFEWVLSGRTPQSSNRAIQRQTNVLWFPSPVFFSTHPQISHTNFKRLPCKLDLSQLLPFPLVPLFMHFTPLPFALTSMHALLFLC